MLVRKVMNKNENFISVYYSRLDKVLRTNITKSLWKQTPYDARCYSVHF